MTEEAKRLIRSLLKALHIFHQHGVCPGQFDESNIVLLKDGKLKFRDITFEAKDETGVLRNYQNVHLILSQLLPDNVPEDIKHLLDLMSSSRSSQMGYMIYTHASLVPLGNRFQFFLQMYEKLKSVLGRAEHQNILDAVPYGDWYKILEDNHLLNNSFHGRRTPYNINGGPTVFLNFYRNTVVHRMENHGQPLKYSYKKLRYTSDEFEEMLAVTFPLYLPKIQEVLDERKMLRALNLENLFSMEAQCNHEKYIYTETTSQETTPLPEYIVALTVYKNVKPVGEKNGSRDCWIMTKEAKRLIRSLLKALYIFHQHGLCPGKFNESNIVILTGKGKAKFTHITFEAKDDSGILRNYEDTHAILQRILCQQSPDNVPKDINHLLELMSSPRSINMGYVIYTHACLLPLGNRYQFFLQMFEKIMSVLDRAVHQDMLNDVPYGDNWHTILQCNPLLKESFHSCENPYDTNGGSTVFLKFYRNTVVHRMENHGQALVYSNKKKLKYTPEEFEEMLAVTFPLYLPKIQEMLQERKMLRALNLHKLF
ncbi:hypothetical protein OsI_06880 [Oryza sativa Indica Group]|uniref:Protein kinase domain-containing protein n=1 Tax=Oryza sativa subsp. indica TaxID=39946 RepID=A2X3U0_ORYSI|nr:hypothetical protein OsI_06880 [Oryza sativa Indica Group]